MLSLKMTPTSHVWAYSIFVSVCGALFGGDTGSIGSITQMPQFTAHFGELSDFMRGFVVAVILIPSAVTGLLAGTVSDRISRKYTISLGCGLWALGMALSIASPNIISLIIARCIAGSGEGFFLSASTVYICEIGPKHLRGRLVSCFQLFISGSIAFAFFVCYGSIKIQSDLAYRLPWALSMSFALVVTIGAPFMPYSPRWLVTRGRREEAVNVLNLLTGPEDEDERSELLAAPAGAMRSGCVEIFDPSVIRRTALGTFLNVFQQLTGIDFVLFYAPLLFGQAGLDPKTSSLIASGVTGIVMFFTNAAGQFYVDHVGRRTLLLIGGTIIAIAHISIGTIYASGASNTAAGKWTLVALIEVFGIAFCGTLSICVRLYSAEIQPSRTRAAASSFGQGANQLVNTVIALTSPAFLAKSPYGPYFMHGGLTAIGTLIAFVYMPETIGHSLETIDQGFQGSAYAVKWPAALKPNVRVLRNRRPSRRRASGLGGESGVFNVSNGEHIAMERLPDVIDETEAKE